MNKTDSVLRNLLVLAFPIIIENLLQSLLATTDIWFAGKISDAAISAISLTSVVMNIFISFFTAVSVGASVIVSRNFGKKDLEAGRSSIVQAILIAFWTGVSAGLICLLFQKPILITAGAKSSLTETALPYFLAVSVPSLFLALQLTLSACLRSLKDSKTPMIVTALSNVLNILLNGLAMQMGLGLGGLGAATSVSRLFGVILLFRFLSRHDEASGLKISDFHFNYSKAKSILVIGGPAGAEKLIMRTGQMVYNGMIISIGMNAYTAHNIAGTIESYAYIPALGIGLAVTTLVSVSLGEGKIDQAMKVVKTGYILSALIMSLIGIGFFIFAKPLCFQFTETAAVAELSAKVIRLIAFFQPFSALVQIMSSALQGCGDTAFPMFSTLVGIWGIRTGLGYVFGVLFHMGLIGVWCAYALDLVLRGIVLLWRYRSERWRSIQI